MNAVRVRRKLESETLHLPEIKPLIGKIVQITVEEEFPSAAQHGGDDPGCFAALAPVQPLDAETKKALETLLTPAQLQALEEIVGQGGPDVEAIRRLRAASMT